MKYCLALNGQNLRISLWSNYYIDISKNFKNKLNALKFYKELRKYPHSRSLVAVEALAKYRGVSSGVKYAEAFYLNRFIDK